MYKIIKFTPRNFGGYTFFLILSGLFLGYASLQLWFNYIVSGVLFFIAMYFYNEDNK